MEKSSKRFLLIFLICLVAIASLSRGFWRNRGGVTASSHQVLDPAINVDPIELPPACRSQEEYERLEEDCLIDEPTLKAWNSHGDFTVIDGRPKEEFDEVSIPGALNIPLRLLKTKSYLRDKKLLLIARNFERRELFESCIGLKTLGFSDVKVLVDGMQKWTSFGLKVRGNQSLINKTRTISSQEFLIETTFRPWALVDTTSEGNLLGQSPDKLILNVPLIGAPEVFIAKMAKTLVARKLDDKPVAILLSDGALKEGMLEQLDQIIIASNLNNVFLIKGGGQILRSHLLREIKDDQYQASKFERLKCGS